MRDRLSPVLASDQEQEDPVWAVELGTAEGRHIAAEARDTAEVEVPH